MMSKNKPKPMSVENWQVLVVDTSMELPEYPMKGTAFDHVVIKGMQVNEFAYKHLELYIAIAGQIKPGGMIVSYEK